jgi:hypothetical protein
LVSPHAGKNAIEFEKLLVVSLFDNLTILENKNPTVDITSRHVNELDQEVTYRSALAMVYNKRCMSNAVFQIQK